MDVGWRCSLGVSFFFSISISFILLYKRNNMFLKVNICSFMYVYLIELLFAYIICSMFMSSCKRLRVMKGSEAKGLGCFWTRKHSKAKLLVIKKIERHRQLYFPLFVCLFQQLVVFQACFVGYIYSSGSSKANLGMEIRNENTLRE